MGITYDPTKSERNDNARGLPFSRVVDFDFNSARIWQDTRRDYSETRYIAIVYLDDRLHALCFAQEVGGIRVISLRKANQREGKKHGFPLTRN